MLAVGRGEPARRPRLSSLRGALKHSAGVRSRGDATRPRRTGASPTGTLALPGRLAARPLARRGLLDALTPGRRSSCARRLRVIRLLVDRLRPEALRPLSAGEFVRAEVEAPPRTRPRACGRTSSTETGRPSSRAIAVNDASVEAAGGDPLGERRRVEVDVERVAVRRHPAS